MDIDNITWSLKTLLLPSVLAMVSYSLFSRSSSGANTDADDGKEKIPVKPEDGTVKVSELLIHPIKVRATLLLETVLMDIR